LIRGPLLFGKILTMQLLQNYRGRAVRLTEERRHHILDHPEMVGLETAIAETLRHPALVVQSLGDPQTALNYRFYFGTRVGDKWLCVVVKYSALDSFVLTAYLTDKPKKGTQLWPKT
jgi:hypothetical protein